MYDWKEDVLCDILHCGSLDLNMLGKVGYDLCEIFETCKMECGCYEFNTIMMFVVSKGLDDLETEISDRICKLEAIANERELDEDEEIELEEIRKLNPHEDAEEHYNYLDTSVWWRDDDKGAYEVYFQDALDRFCENTGIEIG